MLASYEPSQEYNANSTKNIEEEQHVVWDSVEHHLSLNAMKGFTGLGTICFQAQIQGLDIQVLIDRGSSDNLLWPCIAKFLKLPIEEAPMFQVIVGNGNIMKDEQIVKNLAVNM